MIKKYFSLAVKNISSRALRSWLTILGVIIGVFMVIVLFSLSEGLTESVVGELRGAGGNILMVMPGDGADMMDMFLGDDELDDRDLEVIRNTRGVDKVVETPFDTDWVRFENQSEHLLLFGLDFGEGLQVLIEDMGWQMEEGRFPRPGTREVIVGDLVIENHFPDLSPGDNLTVSGREYNLVGIMQSLGERQDDSAVVLDLPEFRSLTGETEGAPVALVRPLPDWDHDQVISNLERNLDETMYRRRGEEDPSYSVTSSEAILEMIENVLSVLQTGILAFAVFAIIVGAIGIMNTMFTAVKQRTREIGLLKAVGAKREHIHGMFLIESGIIGFIGGFLGVGLGLVAARLIEAFLRWSDIQFVIEAHFSLPLILTILVVSFILGCISGFIPARRAAKLDPIEALADE